ncbi:MAG TPA: hypothetical protein VHO24_09735 [Opitutaceae bacterium]|nr:hypothetical protein [Opitutaceae bacterium]
MKTLKFVFAAALLVASSLAARADVSAQAWLESYYLNPQPEQLGTAVRALSRQGYFEKPGHTAIAIGFLSTVFAQNPQRVDGWLTEFNGLPLHHHRLIASALWQAGHPMGAQLLRTLSERSTVAAEVQQLAAKPSLPVADTPVLSPSSMNLQWGAFLATGNERHVIAIFDGIGADRPALSTAARYALAQNAVAHPRVMEICQAQLSKQPNEVQSVLRAALNDAALAGKPHI